MSMVLQEMLASESPAGGHVRCRASGHDHSNTLKHGLKQRVTNTMTPEVLEEQVGVREHQEID